MPSRIFREGFLDSDSVNFHSSDIQNFYTRLFLVADDYGCFDGRPGIISSACYPLSPKNPAIIEKMLAELALPREKPVHPLLMRYEVDGKPYIQIINFDQRVRTRRHKYPVPPISADNCQQTADNCLPETSLESSLETTLETETKTIPEHRAITELLLKRILEIRQIKISEKKKFEWDKEVRRMIERDKRSPEDIIKLINECHDMEPDPKTGFTWRTNILSMSTLRLRWNEGKIGLGMNRNSKKERVQL